MNNHWDNLPKTNNIYNVNDSINIFLQANEQLRNSTFPSENEKGKQKFLEKEVQEFQIKKKKHLPVVDDSQRMVYFH